MIVKIYSVNLYCNIYKIQLNFLRGKNENENYLVIQLYFVYVSAQVYCKFMLSTLIFFSLWIRRQLVVKRKVTDKKVLQLVVKVLDSHCPVSLCSNLLVNSFPFFLGREGGGLGHFAGVQGSKPLGGPKVDSAFTSPEFDQMDTRNFCRQPVES